MPRILPILLVLLVCQAGAAELFSSVKAKHIVILVIDGPRRTETWDEPQRQYIPHQAKELAPQGTLYPDFRNRGFTYTNSGHAALVSGYSQQIENGGHEQMEHAGILQRYLRASGKPATAAQIITSKDKLFILGDCSDPEWTGRWLPLLDCGLPGKDGKRGGYRDDPVTHAHVLAALKAAVPPDLLLINYRGPDSMGHGRDWTGYLQAIRETDGYAAEVWATIQSVPALHDTTDLFITSDHGRHDDGHASGYVDHGDDCPGCHKIALVALGPDFAKGKVIDRQRNLLDLAVTMARMIGIPLPRAQGEFMDELFPTPLSAP